MGSIQQSYNNRVRYTLYHLQDSLLLKDDPIGWDSDEKELSRNEEYDGIFPKFSNSLKFIGDGRDYLKFIYDVYGINAEIRMTKEEKDPDQDLWELSYDGYLDMSTFELQDNRIGIKFNAGGLEQILKARESEEVEIDRETTLDGTAITPLQTLNLEREGRRIFLKSSWEANKDDNTAITKTYSTDGNQRHDIVGFPIVLKNRSHEEAQSVGNNTSGNELQGVVDNMFFALSTERRTLHIYGDVRWQMFLFNFIQTTNAFYGLFLSIYNNGEALTVKERRPLWVAGGSNNDGEVFVLNGQTITKHIDETVVLEKNESISLEFWLNVQYGAANGYFSVFSYIDKAYSNLKVDEDSFFEKTNSEFILVHEAADRLCEIMTSKKKVFYSDFFGRTDLGYTKNGIGAFTGLQHGFWIRGFKKLPLTTPEEPNLFKPLTLSWKTLFDSLAVTHAVGLGIEHNGFTERIRIEDKRFFYQRVVTIKLPNQAKKVKRTVATKYFYSSLELGYDKGGTYDEAMGLDEYNTKSTFTTCITRLKQPFTKISQIRTDSYGAEFARRKQFFRYPTTDTSYDDNIFMLDLKKALSGIFKERKWQDDFSEAPTGTYDPDSATNLRFSPFNLLLKHGWVIGSGLVKYPTDYIRYGSATANSNLKTKLRNDSAYLNDTSATVGNGNAYTENDKILNSELNAPRYVPEYIEFEHQLDYKLLQQIEGFTIHNGTKIMNVYGLIEFTNENGDIEKGFLMNLKLNDGKFKVLKFNR